MKIYKRFNNNVVQSINEFQQEVIVMGSGIAFQKQVGGWIDNRKIEKIFVLQDSQLLQMISRLLNEIPVEYFELSEKVISFAESYLKTKLNESIHLTLVDHISFSIARYQRNDKTDNPLLWDIKRLYSKEFAIGIYALDLIYKKYSIRFEEDEAGFIAMHIINAQLNEGNLIVPKIMEIVQNIIKIVRYQLNIKVDENSLSFNRFVTHLKFFSQRVLTKEQIEYSEPQLLTSIKKNYPDAYKGAKIIKKYIDNNYDYCVDEEELTYLSIHLQRLIK